MPSSSAASAGYYKPTPVSEQNYVHQPSRLINVDLNEVSEVPIVSNLPNFSKFLTFGGLAAVGTIIVVACVLPTVLITQRRTSTTNSSTNSTTTSFSNSTSSTTLANGSSTTSASSSSTVAPGFTAGGNVTSSTTSYFGYEDIFISCSTTTLTNITIQIIVQRTVNATYSSNSFSTFWSGTVNQAYVTNSTQITYTWTIASGQVITCSGGPYKVEAQFTLYGTSQTTSADTYSVRATTNTGVTSTLSGHF